MSTSLRSSGGGSRTGAPASRWAPAHWTRPRYRTTDGLDVTDFAASLLRVPKGVRAGAPLYFTDWQEWWIKALLERRPDGRLRHRQALLGLPRKNGKSLLGSAIALYGLFMGEPGAEVYSAAGDRQQARIVFNEAKAQVQSSPALNRRAKCYRDAIEVPGDGAVYRVLSADAKLQQGLNPSLVVFDELHVQPNDDLWDALTQGSGARVDPLVLAITTAGHDLDSLCGRLYTYGCQVAAGLIDDPSFGFWWWEAKAGCARHDRKQWERANPNLAEGLLDDEDMADAAKPGRTSEQAFRRFRLNQWVRVAESWLPAGAWEDCTVENISLVVDAPTWVGIDMALKHDSIAVVAVQRQGDRWVAEAKVWFPSGSTIDVADVELYLRKLHLDFDVREFAYDPAYFERSAQALVDDGLPMVEFPQSAQRMVPACQTAYAAICTGELAHNGDPVFTDQVLSAATRHTDQGWRLSKGKSKRKIDAAVALAIALDRATAAVEEPPEPLFMFT